MPVPATPTTKPRASPSAVCHTRPAKAHGQARPTQQGFCEPAGTRSGSWLGLAQDGCAQRCDRRTGGCRPCRRPGSTAAGRSFWSWAEGSPEGHPASCSSCQLITGSWFNQTVRGHGHPRSPHRGFPLLTAQLGSGGGGKLGFFCQHPIAKLKARGVRDTGRYQGTHLSAPL